MTAYRNLDDDEDDDDWEDDESDFGGDDDDPPTVPCPYCRCEILEDSPRCPSCGRYISAEDVATAGKPAWVILTAFLCLGIAIWWVVATLRVF
jgi:hypothetical protein